jgi:hypothetical protein
MIVRIPGSQYTRDDYVESSGGYNNENGFISSINRAAEQTFMIRNEAAVGMHILLLFDDSVLTPYADQVNYDDVKANFLPT